MNDSETYEFEGRRYVNPTLSSGEQTAFLNVLKDVVGQKAAQANRETEALGAAIPSSQGGLTGAGAYFAQRYQTTPVEATTASLKSASQLQALNDLLGNYQSQYKNRYNQAYRSAVRTSVNGSGGEGGDGDDAFEKQPFDEYTTEESIMMPLEGWPEELESVTGYGALEGSTSDGGTYGYRYYQGTTKDGLTGIVKTDNPNYWQSSNGLYYNPTPYMTDRTRAQALSDEMKRALADRIARSRGEL